MVRIRMTAIAGVILAGCIVFICGNVPAQEKTDKKETPPQYVGTKACKKCHQKSSIGKQYKIWEESKHAKTFEVLKSEEAQAVITKLGLSNKAFEEPKCLKCHVAGYGHPETYYGSKYSPEEGVTCEACHGPAEFFDKPADEKTHKEAVGKGYIKPDEKLCRTCHNDNSPTWDPARDTTEDGKKVGF
ncbi:MAG: cytochrome c family protein, partial [Planctomycetes bacterium]|nr:cytochrome c family protein [Planctomycetota bacterium]